MKDFLFGSLAALSLPLVPGLAVGGLPIGSSPLVERIGWTLLHSVWQLSAIAVVAALANHGLKQHSAKVRYLVSVLGMMAMLAAPCVTWPMIELKSAAMTSRMPNIFNPGHLQKHQTRGEPVAFVGDPVSLQLPVLENGFNRDEVQDDANETTRQQTNNVDLIPVIVPLASSDRASRVSRPNLTQTFQKTVETSLPVIVLFWLAGVLVLAIRPLLGLWTQWHFRRVGRVPVPAIVEKMIHDLCRQMGIRQIVHVFESTRVHGPLVIGYLRPMILIPASVLSGLTPSQLESLLAHELAHIRRHDWLVNALQVVIETLLFYHPAVWWLSNQIRNERELCCDDLALCIIGDRAQYSRMLLALEELRYPNGSITKGFVMRSTLAATGGNLVQRVRRLLPNQPKDEHRSRGWLSGVIVLMAVVAACGLWCTTYATAENQPPTEAKSDAVPQETNDKAKKEETAGDQASPVKPGEMTPEDALEFYNKAIKLDPKDAKAYVARAGLLSNRAESQISTFVMTTSNATGYADDLEHAIRDLSEAIRLDPMNAETRAARGSVYLQTRQHDAALEDFNDSIRLSKMNAPAFLPTAYLGRANAWELKGEYTNAVLDSIWATRAGPKSASAFANLARLKATCPDRGIRNRFQAVKYATKAWKLVKDTQEKETWYYLDTLAAAYAEARDFETAIKWEKQAISQLQDKIAARLNDATAKSKGTEHLSLIFCAEHLALYRDGKPCRMESTNPEGKQDPAARTNAKWTEDLKKFDEAIALNPTDSAAYFNRGDAWALRAGAKPYVNRANKLIPPENTEFVEHALSDLNDAIRLDPKNANAYRVRGRVFACTKKNGDAIKDLDEAIRLDPLEPTAYASRGDCRNELGEFENAAHDWLTGMKLDPDNKTVFLSKLAWLRATCPDECYRNGKQAVDYAAEAGIYITPYQPAGFWDFLFFTRRKSAVREEQYEFCEVMAAGLAEIGDFRMAIKYQEMALRRVSLRRDTKTGANALLPDVEERMLMRVAFELRPNLPPGGRERLELYRANKPYREIPQTRK